MSFEISLKNKIAVVTGSSRGLGKAMAVALASAGADIVITSRDIESLYKTEKEITAMGRDVLKVNLEVKDNESIKDLVKQTLDKFGKIDIYC
ncbi:MAG: SDR family NAD(P)-dependent oxidoreductase [Candidatus Omnitrophica bacterium]|nr:SDR family NAD(P)-dependent oxidoreductase [Candidatus Omnitrophota bacterium]